MVNIRYPYSEYCKAYRARCKREHICQRCGKQDERTLAGRAVCAACNEKLKPAARIRQQAVDKAKKKEIRDRHAAKKKAINKDKQWFADHNLPYTAPDEIAMCINCTLPECIDCIGKGRRKKEYQAAKKKEETESET